MLSRYDRSTADRILHNIYQLQLFSRDGGWVRKAQLVKRVFGAMSDENYWSLMGYLDLPQLRQYIYVSSWNGAIKLSEKGIQYVKTKCATNALDFSSPESVANVVVSFSSQLGYFRHVVNDIETLSKADNKFVHIIRLEESDELISIGAGTPVSVDGESGTIIGSSKDTPNNFYFLSYTDCSYITTPARLVTDRGFLFSKLAEQIYKLKCSPQLLTYLLENCNKGTCVFLQNSLEISRQLLTLDAPCTRLIWGPPGAGKTYGVAKFVADALKQDSSKRILMLAPSNLAADVSLIEVLGFLERNSMHQFLNNRMILRYGYPVKHQILVRPEVLGSREQERLTRRIGQLSTEIEEIKEFADERTLVSKKAKLFEVREELKKAVTNHVNTCSVVSSTTTLGFMPNSPLLENKWDIVIIDEITMVPMAVLYFLASLAKSYLVMTGDPRQLGPVFSEGRNTTPDQRKLFAQDVFSFTGLIASLDHSNSDGSKILYLITEQRRCHRHIWNLLGKWYPKVRNSARLNHELETHSIFQSRLHILDTSHCKRFKCSKVGSSWVNEKSVTLAIHLARNIARRYSTLSIGIITPYASQERLLRNRLQVRQKSKRDEKQLKNIEVGTVHKFQGNSADVIIFDLVGDEGKENLGPLLQGINGQRLMTVAFSRAKESLFVIGDFNWHRKMGAHQFGNPLLRELITLAESAPSKEAKSNLELQHQYLNLNVVRVESSDLLTS